MKITNTRIETSNNMTTQQSKTANTDTYHHKAQNNKQQHQMQKNPKKIRQTAAIDNESNKSSKRTLTHITNTNRQQQIKPV
jgi:hypothetical protein